MKDCPRVVLVTGATSGIGAACATELARAGHRVFGTGRRVVDGTRAGEGAGAFELLRMDVDDDASVADGVGRVLAAAGRVDVVVNNAAFGIGGAIEDTSIAEAKALFETGFFGMLRVVRAVLPSMRARRSGCIVNVSSLAGRLALPYQGLYSAAKFAIEGASDALRMEVAPFGVRVVVVQPGDVATGFTASRREASGAGEGSVYRDAYRRVLAAVERDEHAGVPAADVARCIRGIVENPSPRTRYSVGLAGQRVAARLKDLLPDALVDRLLRGHFGI